MEEQQESHDDTKNNREEVAAHIEERKAPSEAENTPPQETVVKNELSPSSDLSLSESTETRKEEQFPEITEEEDQGLESDQDAPDQIEEAIAGLSLSDLRNRIGEIESEVKQWRSKREELNNQVIEKAKTRNDLNTKVRELISVANDSRKLRDESNLEIGKLKDQKSRLLADTDKLQQIMEKTGAEIEKSPVPSTSGRRSVDFDKQLKELEWKLQTTSNLTIDEERSLVERISKLEEQLATLQEFRELGKERRDAHIELRKKRQELRKTIQSMNKLARESRAHHNKMIEGYHEANGHRKQADGIHSDIQKVKKEADGVHHEYVAKIREKRKFSDALRKHQKLDRDEFVTKSKEKARVKTEEAIQKSKDGKKITFEDFKALINRGLI